MTTEINNIVSEYLNKQILKLNKDKETNDNCINLLKLEIEKDKKNLYDIVGINKKIKDTIERLELQRIELENIDIEDVKSKYELDIIVDSKRKLFNMFSDIDDIKKKIILSDKKLEKNILHNNDIVKELGDLHYILDKIQ